MYHHALVSARVKLGDSWTSKLSCSGVQERGKCENTPEECNRLGVKSWCCFKMEEEQEKYSDNIKIPGNYFQYSVTGSTFEIEKVKSNYCEEDPADCTCMGLFAIALKNTARVDRITAYLPTEGYRTGSLARCRCYLYVASAAGFKFITLENEVEECNGKYEISESKSNKLCKWFRAHQCHKRDNQLEKAAITRI